MQYTMTFIFSYLLIGTIVGLILSPIAYATNGLFSHGYGAKQSGIAGSGVAFPQDALISAVNPAGVVHVDGSTELDVQYFSPIREYTVRPSAASGSFPPFPGNSVESDSESFFIPSIATTWKLASNKTVGFALYGNGGMNTDYATSDTPFGFGTFGAAAVPDADTRTGVDYAQLFANLSYSQSIGGGNSSWGIAAIANYSQIELSGLAGFGPFSRDPMSLSDQGKDTDTGFGVRIGGQFELSPVITAAASYQTEISNQYDKYAGLFPESGKLHIPATAQLGIAAKTGGGTLTADIQHIFYSSAEGVGDPGSTGLTTDCRPSVPITSAPSASGGSCLGGNPGLGFGWEDMTVLKLGYTWSTGGMTWRVGASYGEQPVQEEDVTFNILAPGVIEQHYTMGFSRQMSGGRELSVSLMYAPENCVTGPDLFTPGQTVELCMHQFAINAGLSF